MKYSKKIVEQIIQLVEVDSFTVSEICKLAGISKSTFHDWKRTKPDFLDSLKKAQAEFDENLVAEAKRSLMKKVKGYEFTETKKSINAKGSIFKEETIVKHVPADTTSLIFVLTNKAPDEYRHRAQLDARVSLETKIAGLDESQLDDIIDLVLTKSAKLQKTSL